MGTIPWPMEPFDAPHPLGNSYGEYQNYGSAKYLHPGIDILEPAGTPVYAVKAGWVKAVLTTFAELHWRVAIGDSVTAVECEGWLYAHLDMLSIAVFEGEYVDSGQYLGDLVYWPTSNFHHLHFVKIRQSGFPWTPDWEFIANPLDELVNASDADAPFFEEITPGYPFRFCVDNSDIFFDVGTPLTGDVDIIVQAHDYIGHPDWVLTPYALTYEISSDSVFLGPYTSMVFTGELLWDQVHHVLFKDDAPCVSEGNYDYRSFYESITNHDADTLVTFDDTTGKWATGSLPNDTYTITVQAYDRGGNVTEESMQVATANFYALAGSVTFTDGNPNLSGIEIGIDFTSSSTLTDDLGLFDLSTQPAGTYAVTAEQTGYEIGGGILDVYDDIDLQIEMTPVPFVNGDVNFDGILNVSDVVYLINFVFAGGPYPVPWAAGVNIDPSPTVNISDAVYLINYIFAGGPAPGEGTP
jgi:hypothetical protein